jgi:hypothetical protein
LILWAVTFDFHQNRRRSERVTLDRQRELHKLRVVLLDQSPVDRARKQRADL